MSVFTNPYPYGLDLIANNKSLWSKVERYVTPL